MIILADIIARGMAGSALQSIGGIEVGGAPYINGGYWYVWEKSSSSFINSNILAEGKDGLTPYIDLDTEHWFVGTEDTGIKAVGNDGVGIQSISKTSSSGLTDIYTIYYTDSTTDTFNINNGENGTDGTNGINGLDGKNGLDGFSPVISIETQNTDVYTLRIQTKDKTFVTVNLKGNKGDKGDIGEKGDIGKQGIQGIQGLQGIQGIQGERGADGMGGLKYKEYYSDSIPYTNADVVSFSNGNAYILYVESSIGNPPPTDPDIQKNEYWERFVMRGSQGIQGVQGIKGEQGIQGEKGADGLTTSITVNGKTYTEANGNITIPDYTNDLSIMNNSKSDFISKINVELLVESERSDRILGQENLQLQINSILKDIQDVTQIQNENIYILGGDV